uniref:Uncharacterized protein n=1 Tax=Bos indicus x Bos taurus TaxID=30522 RepID=A0A4W2DYV8_BOBOX
LFMAPVRFEWAVKLSVLLPVSNYRGHLCLPLQLAKAFLQPSIHLNLTTPCPDPGLALKGEEAPRPSPSSFSDLALRPQASPSKFLTLLSQQLLSLRASPGLLSSLCLFPSAAPPPVKPIYIRCLPSSPSVSPPTHRFVVSSGPLNSTSSQVMTFLELNSRHVSGSRTHGHVFSVSLTVFPAPGLWC